MFLPHPRVKVTIVESLRDREVACSASDRQGSNLESCVWKTVSSQSSHHPQEVLLAQFSLYPHVYVHKGGLKPDSFHFIFLDSGPQWKQYWIKTSWLCTLVWAWSNCLKYFIFSSDFRSYTENSESIRTTAEGYILYKWCKYCFCYVTGEKEQSLNIHSGSVPARIIIYYQNERMICLRYMYVHSTCCNDGKPFL